MFDTSKKERDYEVVIDICQDYTGALVMGASSGEIYVAQLVVPAREYIETESENPITIQSQKKEPNPRQLRAGSRFLLILKSVNLDYGKWRFK